MREVVESFFQDQVHFKKVEEILESIEEERKELNSMSPDERSEHFEKVVSNIWKGIFEVEHPIVKKKLEWGFIKGRTQSAKNLKETIRRLLEKGVDSLNDVQELEKGLRDFEEEVKREFERKLFEETDLRMFPGSVALKEAGNLYFGEKYGEEELSKASSWLLNSICIGREIAVYFTDENLNKTIRRTLIKEFNSKHVKEENLATLKIHPSEEDKPHVVLIKFLLWVYMRVESDKQFSTQDLLFMLSKTEGVIFIVPDDGKPRESMIPLPNLDFFTREWIEVPERRRILESMRDSLYEFMIEVESDNSQSEKKRIKNKFKLISNNLEVFCRDLLRQCFINPEPLRRIVDLTIELSSEYVVKPNLSFIKELIS